MKIEQIESDQEIMQNKIDRLFAEQAKKNNIDINYKEYSYVVKDDDGKIMGGVYGYRLYREVYIDDLCIDESIRGKGIGKKLINIIEKEICNNETDCLILNTEKFQNAIGFYKKCGFEVEYIRKNGTDSRFDRYYMIKKIK